MSTEHHRNDLGAADIAQQAAHRKMGRRVLWALIAFFVVFASVDAYFIYVAVNSHSGEVVRADRTVPQHAGEHRDG